MYVDANSAGDPGTRKPTSGFLIMMGNTPNMLVLQITTIYIHFYDRNEILQLERMCKTLTLV